MGNQVWDAKQGVAGPNPAGPTMKRITVVGIIILCATSLLAGEGVPPVIHLEEQIEQASRDLEPILSELEVIDLYPDQEQEGRLQTIKTEIGSFQSRYSPLLSRFQKGAQEKLLQDLKEGARKERLASAKPITESALLEMKLKVAEARLREKRIGEEPIDRMRKQVWGWEKVLSQVDRTIQEGYLLAFLSELAKTRAREALQKLEQETPQILEEKRQKEEALQFLLREAIDPDLKSLKTALFKEQLFQLENRPKALRREAQMAKLTEELSSPSQKRKKLYEVAQREKNLLEILTKEKELLSTRKRNYETLQTKVKSEAELTPQNPSNGLKIGMSLEFPPEMQEKITAAETLLALVTGEEQRLDQGLQKQRELVELVEERLQEKRLSPVGEVVNQAIQKLKEVYRKIIQAIQTVFRLVNSWIPKDDNSRPRPERLVPPKGSLGSDFVIPLIKTDPASIFAASRSAFSRSLVQRLAPRP